MGQNLSFKKQWKDSNNFLQAFVCSLIPKFKPLCPTKKQIPQESVWIVYILSDPFYDPELGVLVLL